MVLPKSLTTVTPFSKTIAMILFILFPFIGFYLGMHYQQQIDSTMQHVFVTNLSKKTINPILTINSASQSNWKTYRDNTNTVTFSYPPNWQYYKDINGVITVNGDRIDLQYEIPAPNQGHETIPQNQQNVQGYAKFLLTQWVNHFEYQWKNPKDNGAVILNGKSYHTLTVQLENSYYTIYLFQTSNNKVAELTFSHDVNSSALINQIMDTVSY